MVCCSLLSGSWQIVKPFLHWLGTPCDEFGTPLPPGSVPPPRTTAGPQDWTPFENRASFETADFLFRRARMPQAQVDDLMKLWAATLLQHDDLPPFNNHVDLLQSIDSSTLGNVPWESFAVSYQGEKPNNNVPEWMNTEYVVWYCNPREIIKHMLDNPDFDGEFDYSAYREYGDDDKHKYKDFMSGDWAWRQSVCFSLSTLFAMLNRRFSGHHCRRPHNRRLCLCPSHSW